MGKRLIPQRRGRGGSHYRSPSHRHVDDVRIPHYVEAQGTIKDLIQAPGRTSPLAVIDFNGKKSYQLAVEGTRVGQKIEIGGKNIETFWHSVPFPREPSSTTSRDSPETEESSSRPPEHPHSSSTGVNPSSSACLPVC